MATDFKIYNIGGYEFGVMISDEMPDSCVALVPRKMVDGKEELDLSKCTTLTNIGQ